MNTPATPGRSGSGVLIGGDAGTGEELAKKLQDVAREAETAVATGERNSRGETTGSIEAHAAQVSIANGARIQVRRRAGDAWMSAVVRFAGGSEHGFADAPRTQRAAGHLDDRRLPVHGRRGPGHAPDRARSEAAAAGARPPMLACW